MVFPIIQDGETEAQESKKQLAQLRPREPRFELRGSLTTVLILNQDT